jgi:hypothetical protein
MRQRDLNAFADANSLEKSRNLAIARELARLYSVFVAEPVPPDLQAYVDRLARTLERRRH